MSINNVGDNLQANVPWENDALVWNDLNFDPTRSGGPVATRPDDVTINNVLHSEFDNGNNQFCGAVEEMPHGALIDAAQNPKSYPHIHCFLKAAVVSATSAQLAANAHKVDLYDLTGFDGSNELGAQLAITIARTGGDAGDIVVTTYGIHHAMDNVGSSQITTK